MDAAGAQLVADLGSLRAALDRRRRERPPLRHLLERLIGLELKLRQYQDGKVFCDAVVAQAGVPALHRAFAAPRPSRPSPSSPTRPPGSAAPTRTPCRSRQPRPPPERRGASAAAAAALPPDVDEDARAGVRAHEAPAETSPFLRTVAEDALGRVRQSAEGQPMRLTHASKGLTTLFAATLSR